MDYLNSFVRPHKLISFSLFEDSHNAWMFAEDQEEARKNTMISYRAVVTHYGPEDRYIFDEKNDHLRGSTPLFGFKLLDKEAKNRAQGKFMVSQAFNVEEENPDELFLCNPDQAEELESKEEWVAKMEQAVICMQGKLD